MTIFTLQTVACLHAEPQLTISPQQQVQIVWQELHSTAMQMTHQLPIQTPLMLMPALAHTNEYGWHNACLRA